MLIAWTRTYIGQCLVIFLLSQENDVLLDFFYLILILNISGKRSNLFQVYSARFCFCRQLHLSYHWTKHPVCCHHLCRGKWFLNSLGLCHTSLSLWRHNQSWFHHKYRGSYLARAKTDTIFHQEVQSYWNNQLKKIKLNVSSLDQNFYWTQCLVIFFLSQGNDVLLDFQSQ